MLEVILLGARSYHPFVFCFRWRSLCGGPLERCSSWGARKGAGHLTMEVVVWGQGGGLTLACVVAGGPSVSGLAPPKFSLPHRAVCFGAGGQLVLVCPHSPAEGQQPLVELHSLEVRPSSQIHPRFPSWSCPFHPIPHSSGLLSGLPDPLLHLISSPHGLLGLVVPAHTWASLSAFGPISCSFGSTTLVLSKACSQRSPSLGVDVVRTSLRDRSADLPTFPRSSYTETIPIPRVHHNTSLSFLASQRRQVPSQGPSWP